MQKVNSKVSILFSCLLCFVEISEALDTEKVDSNLDEAIRELDGKSYVFDNFIEKIGVNPKDANCLDGISDKSILNALQEYNFEHFTFADDILKEKSRLTSMIKGGYKFTAEEDNGVFMNLNSLVDMCQRLKAKASNIFKQIDENPSISKNLKPKTILWTNYGKACDGIDRLGFDNKKLKSKIFGIYKNKAFQNKIDSSRQLVDELKSAKNSAKIKYNRDETQDLMNHLL